MVDESTGSKTNVESALKAARHVGFLIANVSVDELALTNSPFKSQLDELKETRAKLRERGEALIAQLPEGAINATQRDRILAAADAGAQDAIVSNAVMGEGNSRALEVFAETEKEKREHKLNLELEKLEESTRKVDETFDKLHNVTDKEKEAREQRAKAEADALKAYQNASPSEKAAKWAEYKKITESNLDQDAAYAKTNASRANNSEESAEAASFGKAVEQKRADFHVTDISNQDIIAHHQEMSVTDTLTTTTNNVQTKVAQAETGPVNVTGYESLKAPITPNTTNKFAEVKSSFRVS